MCDDDSDQEEPPPQSEEEVMPPSHNTDFDWDSDSDEDQHAWMLNLELYVLSHIVTEFAYSWMTNTFWQESTWSDKEVKQFRAYKQHKYGLTWLALFGCGYFSEKCSS